MKTSLAQIPSAARKWQSENCPLHHANCPALIWQSHHFSVSGKILKANASNCCRQIFGGQAHPYRSYMSQAKLGKLNKNSFHRPLLLAPYHSQQNRVKWESSLLEVARNRSLQGMLGSWILNTEFVFSVADKFWYMLTHTGATCLKLCRAKSLKVRPLHPST